MAARAREASSPTTRARTLAIGVCLAAVATAGLPVVAAPVQAVAATAADQPAVTVRASSTSPGSDAAALATSSVDPSEQPPPAADPNRAELLAAKDRAELRERSSAATAQAAAAAASSAAQRAATANAAATRSQAAATRAATTLKTALSKRKTKRARAAVRRARAAATSTAAAARRARTAADAARRTAGAAAAASANAQAEAAAARTEADAARTAVTVSVAPSAPVAGSTPSRAVTWRSQQEVRGATVEVTWASAVPVSRVRMVGSGAEDAFRTGVLRFSDGSSLQVTANRAGDLDVSFPRRTVTKATLLVEHAQSAGTTVSLSAVRLDDSGTYRSARPTATATASAGDAKAALDGDLAKAALGQTWVAGKVATAELDVRWSSPRVLASMQVLGIPQNAVNPAASTAEPVRGEVVFSDGSSVPIAGISGGTAEPTVVAFTPRVVSGATVRLTRLASSATLGARELGFYDVGVTPPRVEARGAGYVVERPSTSACDPTARAAVAARVLLCPLTGADVDGTTTLAVRAAAGSLVTARATVPGQGIVTVGSARATDAGIARVVVDANRLTSGPLNIGLVRGDAPSTRPFVYAQVVNRGGVDVASAAPGRAGMTLQWTDDFSSPLSVSRWGRGASYSAVKPEYWGEGPFGTAVFAKPEDGANTLNTDDGYLRIRVKDIGTAKDPNGWGRKHLGGMMSSMRVGGSGFSAQHGYFEARILGAPGKGTWPAFWMMDTQGSTQKDVGSAETDAIELYGQDTGYMCNALHTWVTPKTGAVRCPRSPAQSDWALTWHTYAVQIVPNGADFYVDGRLINSLRNQDFTDRPMFFMLNLALGGGYPVELAGTDNLADMWVDWVRVYT